jgi:hypothetical protein
MRTAVAAAALLAVAACASPDASLGPLRIRPPKGWLVTDRERDSIKITNGTIADENSTQPGTATAVFDVYIDSDQTPAEFKKVLDESHASARTERLVIGGYKALIVAYPTGEFGPSSEVVFVPDWHVRIVYRAAFPDAEYAFESYRAAFRRALRSIRFSGRPPQGA